jgi:hypothetical protein
MVVVALVAQFQIGEVVKLHWAASTLTEGGKSTLMQPPSCPPSGSASERPPMHAPSWHVAPPVHAFAHVPPVSRLPSPTTSPSLLVPHPRLRHRLPGYLRHRRFRPGCPLLQRSLLR